QLDTGDVRQSIVEDNAIELLHVVLLQRRFAIGSDRDFDIFAPQHLADLGRIEFVVFDQQDPPHFLFMERENVVEKLVERLIFQRFQQEAAGAPFQRERTVLFAGDQMDRNMPVVQIVTQQVQHLPAARIGKLDVQGNGNRREPVDKIEDLDIVRGDDSLQVMLMGLFDDDLPESQVVLDDQDDLVALLDAVAIVAGIVDHLADDVHFARIAGIRCYPERTQQGVYLSAAGAQLQSLVGVIQAIRGLFGNDPRAFDGHKKRKGASPALRAFQLDGATQQFGKPTADRKAQTGSTVFPAGGSF